MRPASSLQRFAAGLLDGLLFLPLLSLDRHVNSKVESQWLVFFYFAITWQAGWLYSTLLHGWRGQTLGKLRRHIQLVRFADGGPVGYKRAALRDLPYIVLILISTCAWIYAHVAWSAGWYDEQHAIMLDQLDSITAELNIGWTLLECITMLLHPQRRALHDLIAGTIVIRKTA